jgi:hypothetical protein
METNSMRKIYLVEGNSSVFRNLSVFHVQRKVVTGLSFNIHIFIEYNLLGNRRLDDLPNAGTTVLQPWTTPRVPWRIEQIKVPLSVRDLCLRLRKTSSSPVCPLSRNSCLRRRTLTFNGVGMTMRTRCNVTSRSHCSIHRRTS